MKVKSKLTKTRLPKVTRGKKVLKDFPVDHYSYSAMVQFSSNPILFKIKYVNKDRYETISNISSVVGQAFHKAMEVYYVGDEVNNRFPTTTAEAIEFGMKAGLEFLEMYNDGWIQFSSTIPTKQKAYEIFSFIYNSYIKEMNDEDETILSVEEELKELISVKWKGKKVDLPIKLKGYTDKIIEKNGKIIIHDYKTCRSFSDPEKIDGAKIIQAIIYYLLVYAKYGKEPYSMIYEEVKMSKDSLGKQVKRYEIVYAENELYFDFFFRFYEDITQSLLGHAVYVPNVYTFFDNEVAIISYIHRLDETEERAKQMEALKVDNITDLLKKKIQSVGNMNKFIKTVEKQFISAKNLNYSTMENHEKIQTKLMEYGMMLQFEQKIEGSTVDLYKFQPSIGLKMSKLKSYVADIEQVLGKDGVRVLAPIPNSTYVGFEVPRDERVYPELPKLKGFELAIGQTIMKEERYYDIRQAPHIMVAGTTGSGKSYFLHSLIKQLLKLPNVELHLFDPKMVEMNMYEEEKKVVEYKHNHASIALALDSLVEEMEKRYEELKAQGKRNIEGTKLKYKFVFIDEYADLAVKAGVASNIQLLAQKGRACGIHLVVATQRASTKVISGDVKVNFPVKAVFKMDKEVSSRIMLDESGAEKLLGRGDMLFYSDKGLERLQGYNMHI